MSHGFPIPFVFPMDFLTCFSGRAPGLEPLRPHLDRRSRSSRRSTAAWRFRDWGDKGTEIGRGYGIWDIYYIYVYIYIYTNSHIITHIYIYIIYIYYILYIYYIYYIYILYIILYICIILYILYII